VTTAASSSFGIRDRQKRLGQYFTGTRLATLLATISGAQEARSIIDPMAGTGDMLTGCLMAGAKPNRLYGVEIDPLAHAISESRFAGQNAQLVLADAFTHDFGADPFDLVITNVPYIRYQSLSVASGPSDSLTVPSATQVRAGLIRHLSTTKILSPADQDEFVGLAREYSGLSDIAVPSWLLAASLVRPGGTLAVVVPQAWLARSYASPINTLLRRWFETLYVIEDGDASWFADAQVRTTLVVARRLHGPMQDPEAGGYLQVRLTRQLADESSVVAALGGDRKFADELRSWRRDGAVLDFGPVSYHPVRGHVRSRVDGSGLGPSHIREQEFVTNSSGCGLPAQVQAVLRHGLESPSVTLGDIGWSIGQGLRTGGNVFFYCDRVAGSSRVRTASALGGRLISLPNGTTVPVVRRQTDLSGFSVDVDSLDGRVLFFEGWATRADLDAAALTPRHLAAHRSKIATLSSQVAAYLDEVATIVVDIKGRKATLPTLSAVSTNVRRADFSRPDVMPRFWYQLPVFAPRHTGDLLVARVCGGSVVFRANPGRLAVVDANFSTLWRSDPGKAPAATQDALIAYLNCSFVQAVLECRGAVLGGGALKVEAAHLRELPVPVFEGGVWLKLARLGNQLRTGDDPISVKRRIDKVVAAALAGKPAAGEVEVRLRDLCERKRADRGQP
jgi:hypothetical protein